MSAYEKLSYQELQDLCRKNRKDVSECKLTSSREELIGFLEKKNLCKVPSVGQLLKLITDAIRTRNSYFEIHSDNIFCQLRISTALRRMPSGSFMRMRMDEFVYDVDIVKIKVKSTHRQGCASLFILRLIKAASLLKIPRGVYLEQTITDASQALAASLIKKGIMFPDPTSVSEYGNFNFLSYYPFDTEGIENGNDDDSLGKKSEEELGVV